MMAGDCVSAVTAGLAFLAGGDLRAGGGVAGLADFAAGCC